MAMVKNGKHIFVTNSDGSDIAKSPEGMFELEIENDLKMVDDTIRKFWKVLGFPVNRIDIIRKSF